MEWMLMPYRRYADFSGRSRRMEFWMYQLLGLIVGVVLYGLVLAGGGLDARVNTLTSRGIAVHRVLGEHPAVDAANSRLGYV